jgi:hypothetical protein
MTQYTSRRTYDDRFGYIRKVDQVTVIHKTYDQCLARMASFGFPGDLNRESINQSRRRTIARLQYFQDVDVYNADAMNELQVFHQAMLGVIDNFSLILAAM